MKITIALQMCVLFSINHKNITYYTTHVKPLFRVGQNLKSLAKYKSRNKIGAPNSSNFNPI